jgi:hypothetical protein
MLHQIRFRINNIWRNKMKKYKLKKERFLEWIFSDRDDIEYWGRRFVKDLTKEHKINFTLQELFEERDELPIWLMVGYEDYDYMGEDFVYDMDEIELID